MSVGVLISHHSHVVWAKNRWPNCILIAKEMATIQLNRHEEIEYFYSNSNSTNISEEAVVFFADNWYRDANGIDKVQRGFFSFPQVLTGSIRIVTASLIRDFEAVDFWSKKVERLYVSSLENKIFKFSLQQHPNLVRFYNPPNEDRPFSEWLQCRKLRDYLSIDRKWANQLVLRIAWMVQSRIFRKTKDACKLIFSDWTNIDEPNIENSIWTNHKDLRKSALIFTTRRSMKESRFIIDSQVVPFVDSDWIQGVFHRLDVGINSKLAETISQYLRTTITQNRKIITLYHAQITKLFENYSISSVQLPAELFEPYVVALQLAKSRNIKTSLVIDGHDPTGLSVPTLRSPDGAEFLLDQFSVPSELLYSSAVKNGFKDRQIIRKNSIFHQYYRVGNSLSRDFDVMLLTWTPNQQNPNARIDSPSLTLESSLSVLCEHFDGLLAIKVKDPKIEIEYVEKIVDQLGLERRIKILTGRFSDHVCSSKLIVGGLSSALAEAMIHEIPYIIYEPIENGYSDRCLRESSVLDFNRIARTTSDLMRLVEEGSSSIEVDRFSYLNTNSY
jgi:hypothetical protein